MATSQDNTLVSSESDEGKSDTGESEEKVLQTPDILNKLDLAELIPSFEGKSVFFLKFNGKKLDDERVSSLVILLFSFKAQEIDVECLENLTENDLVLLIPTINLRIKFRARLNEYKRKRLESSVETTPLSPSATKLAFNQFVSCLLMHVHVIKSSKTHFVSLRTSRNFWSHLIVART